VSSVSAWRKETSAAAAFQKYVAVERHHPKGSMWETGTSLKGHDWFIIPLSKAARDVSC